MNFSFKKENRLTTPEQIRSVLKSPRRLKGDGFVLRWRFVGEAVPLCGGTPRFCISVSRGVAKSAVARNRIRRLVKEFLRLHKTMINQKVEAIVQVVDYKLFSYNKIEKELKLLFQKAGLLK